eukprot:TRINITY_DN22239_c0_g1_i1.p1 TRINITY_DN22239_c0_g1~~TRINITY_DN22239_c0_g1_i1.p1  ORF type:complete len:371 (+),score=195.28 TRINITY_DN22239_c0_g1_i1:51-1163(+)
MWRQCAARCLPGRQAMRFYATEAEYLTVLKQDAATQALIAGKEPFFVHFTSQEHPALGDHNQMVKDAMAGVNSEDVQLKYLVADIKEPMAQQLMQMLQIQQAPAAAAIANGQALDTFVGLKEKEFVGNFLDKFLEFLGKKQPSEAAPEDAEAVAEGDDSRGRFARLILGLKKTGKNTDPEVVEELKAIIALAEGEVAAEKEARRKQPPAQKRTEGAPKKPEATPSMQCLANANLLLCDTLQQQGLHAEAKDIHDKVKKEFRQYQLPAVEESLLTIEMAILSKFDHLPAEYYATEVVKDATNVSLQLRLSVGLFREGRKKEAVGLMLQMLRKYRSHEDGIPKQLLLCAFALLGPKDPITTEGQKKMMAYLH